MEKNQNTTELILTRKDYERLSLLIDEHPRSAALLAEELDRAKVVDAKDIPKDVVTMNSKVTFMDLETDQESNVTLVFPPDANADERKVSVLAPIGSALIGLRIGQEIEWPMPNGKVRRVRVTGVEYQPESAGDWHL